MDTKEYYMKMPYDLSGSMSKNRFRVEMLWGVGKMIEMFSQEEDFVMIFDYVCDIEIHYQNRFEFYQIKSHNAGTSAYTPKSLTKRKSDKDSGSILGKLFILNPTGSEGIKLAVVSNVPFSDNRKMINASETCFDDMSEKTKAYIENKLKEEFKMDDVSLSSLYYICTTMDLRNPENSIVGQLVLTINKVKGCEPDRPGALYRLIYDEVEKKATYEEDIKTYEELVEHKGINKAYFESIICCHLKNEKTGVSQTSKYIDSLSDIMLRKKLKKALAKLVNIIPVSKPLQALEKRISDELRDMEARNESLDDLQEVVAKLMGSFRSEFTLEYSDAEKMVFCLIVTSKFVEGVYDEDDI